MVKLFKDERIKIIFQLFPQDLLNGHLSYVRNDRTEEIKEIELTIMYFTKSQLMSILRGNPIQPLKYSSPK